MIFDSMKGSHLGKISRADVSTSHYDYNVEDDDYPDDI